MRTLIRLFFRGVRLVLAPLLLVYEKLTTPKPKPRTEAEQAALDKAAARLALYQFRTCPFCLKVRKEIARLGLPIELRDARNDMRHREALAAGGGRIKVPCLRIQHSDGREEWLYESDVINAWLCAQFETITPA